MVYGYPRLMDFPRRRGVTEHIIKEASRDPFYIQYYYMPDWKWEWLVDASMEENIWACDFNR